MLNYATVPLHCTVPMHCNGALLYFTTWNVIFKVLNHLMTITPFSNLYMVTCGLIWYLYKKKLVLTLLVCYKLGVKMKISKSETSIIKKEKDQKVLYKNLLSGSSKSYIETICIRRQSVNIVPFFGEIYFKIIENKFVSFQIYI